MPQSLWDFAVDRYARPELARLCLQLQDQHGADVCLLLAGLWLEHRGVLPSSLRITRLTALALPWQSEVIAPLRQLRRAWKGPAASDGELAELRRQLAALELEAERRLLLRIDTLAADWPIEDPAGGGGKGWLEALSPADDDARQALRVAAGVAPGN